MSSSEADAIERAKQNPAAFGELYDRYVDRIYNYIVYRVGDAGDAEDLTARVFQRALVKMPDYVDRGAPFGAWLYRISHNLIANWYRDTGRYERVSFESLDTTYGGIEAPRMVGDQMAERMMGGELITRAIRRLDADRQSLLILKFNQGLSNAEIASVLGRSEGAIKSLYHRTLLALREQLEVDSDAGSGQPRP
jgi:RNA polymerase sigma-70 factor (ECF subfamily)